MPRDLLARFRVADIAALLALTAACGDAGSLASDAGATSQPAVAGESVAPKADSDHIDVPSTVRANLGITFAPVERRRVEQTLRVAGRFEYAPTARREYHAMLAGRVELLVEPLRAVEAGDPLFRLDSPDWHAWRLKAAESESASERLLSKLAALGPLRAAHHEHEARLEDSIAMLEERVARLAELGEAGGGRFIELAEARTALAGARAEAAAEGERDAELDAERAAAEVELAGERARHALLLSSMSSLLGLDAAELVTPEGGGEPVPRWRATDVIVVTAAEPGVVESLALSNGAVADERALVLTVVRPDRLRFRGLALQSDLGLLRDGLEARIVPPVPTNARGAVGLASTMSGRLTLGLAADPESRAIELFVTPAELAPWARPGVTAQLEIVTDATAAPELAVPIAAVQQDGLEAVLFRRDPKDPDRVIRIEGDLGASDGRWVAVSSGLRDGDEVVLDGSFQLMLATSGSMQKGGHFHADGTYHEGED